MSFDIYIGEAVTDINEETGRAEVVVARTEHPDAPTFAGDGMTKNENHRHPSYSTWSEFVRKTRLDKLFFDGEGGLMREHPGTCRLEPAHLAKIQATLATYRRKHPKARPGWRFGEDPVLARLIWLEFWVRWALANCKVPTIYNH